MKKLYIVTGASGLVGNNLVRKLLSTNEDVRILVLENKNTINIDTTKVKIVKGDVCNIKTLEPLFNQTFEYEKVICIHCAGVITISSKNDDRVYNVNVNGTKNIIEMCKKYKVSKLVYVSSVHALPEKEKGIVMSEVNHFKEDKLKGIYAKTKAIATNLVLEAAKDGLNATVVQPSGIIGPYDYYEGNFTAMIIAFLKNKLPVIVSGGYDFVDVRDVVDGIISASSKGRSGECYLLTNKYYTVQELINTLAKVTGKKPIKTKIPRFVITPLAPLAEIYYKITKQKPLFTPYSLFVLNSNALFSHEKATKELDYKPRSLDITLKDTVEFLKKTNKI